MIAQPRMQASASGRLEGAGYTSATGTTAYSASPAMLYIATGEPSFRRSRLSPSYSVPLSRFIAKNVSQRSSRPRAQGWQVPQGMMNEQMTWSPVFTPPTPGPISATTPEISWPRTAGSGNFTSPLTTCRSVWQTPHAVTLTRTSPARGAGRGRSSITREPPISDRTAAFMSRSLLTESKAQELPDDGPFPGGLEGGVHRRELHLAGSPARQPEVCPPG